jgi:hypothetical protein
VEEKALSQTPTKEEKDEGSFQSVSLETFRVDLTDTLHLLQSNPSRSMKRSSDLDFNSIQTPNLSPEEWDK